MTDISLIPILRSEGWKVLSKSKMKSMKKKELIETIETLENNYGATIERANNSYSYGKSEIDRLENENAELHKKYEKQKEINKELVDENEELKEKVSLAGYRIAELKMQIEKMKCCGNCDKDNAHCYQTTVCDNWEIRK